eukprot:c46031_g1_i1.p1 GENE.c46031_g1_i1~~c46031_g1_i1.p1  ORF type:complete len:180 (+),score=32.02 c46031_g1_i1:37-540(+)
MWSSCVLVAVLLCSFADSTPDVNCHTSYWECVFDPEPLFPCFEDFKACSGSSTLTAAQIEQGSKDQEPLASDCVVTFWGCMGVIEDENVETKPETECLADYAECDPSAAGVIEESKHSRNQDQIQATFVLLPILALGFLAGVSYTALERLKSMSKPLATLDEATVRV